MESENLTIIEQLEKLRITSSSEIPPHEFLYTWNGVPCFARGELVAVTGKAKSGKTYLNSILMAAAGTSALSRGAGNELEPAYNAGLTDKGHFLGLERIQYDMPNKIQFCVDKKGLPVGCAENSGLTSEAQDKEKQGGGFNGEYVGADGKIDKAKLFGYILQGGSLAWNDLRTKLMQTAHIRSVHFAETLMQEARDGGLMQTLLINGRREYLLQRQQKLFDEDT